MVDGHVHLWRHDTPTPTPSLDDLARIASAAHTVGVDHVVIAEHFYRFRQSAGVLESSWNGDSDESLRSATARVVERERTADLDGYVEAIQRAQAAGLPLSLGLELDYAPGADNALAEFVAVYPFDVILGSIHWLGAWLFDAYDHPVFGGAWARRSVARAWDDYTNSFEALCASQLCDVVSHCDLVKIAGRIPDDRTAWEERMLAAIVAAPVAVEVSSAGWRKEIGELYPSLQLLDKLIAQEVRLVLGSDAHEPALIGYRFDELSELLRGRGISAIAKFRAREMEMAALS
jgi:histidinol-phosphatase (PHP family)